MRPSLLGPEDIEAHLDAGHWSRRTMADRYRAYAKERPAEIACRDAAESYTWERLDDVTDRLAASLIERGLERDSRALVRMPSSCREIVLRIALKKAGIIGVFVPMQWRRKELDHVWRRIEPDLAVLSPASLERGDAAWLDRTSAGAAGIAHRIDPAPHPAEGWLGWRELIDRPPRADARGRIADREFAFDEVSLITASSGTSGLAKLCEWPEAAQLCAGRAMAGRLGVTADDNVGVFAPMSGAAGVIAWTASGAAPCSFTFPHSLRAAALLDAVQRSRITVATTVPVILARLAREPLESFDLRSLRALRVGTAAADLEAARSFENRTGCRVVVAAGSMECPGFAHAGVDEPQSVRLGGSIGLPLPGGRLRIEDERGRALPAGAIGELKVAAPFASSGYWGDPQATRAAWSNGWYASGDIGSLDGDGRLTLLGRVKDVINRSGHKILPAEVEREIARHPDVFECAVVKAPDAEYGEAPWAFVQLHPGRSLDGDALADSLREAGLATYKIPARIVALPELPRVNGNKIDRKALLRRTPAGVGT